MSVNLSVISARKPSAMAQLVASAKEIAGVPAICEKARTIKKSKKRKLEIERQLKLQEEWDHAENLQRKKQERENEVQAEKWRFFLLLIFLVSMFRANPRYQPEIAF